MNKQRLQHIMALLGALATAVAPVWLDKDQTLPAQIAVTIATALFLGVGTTRLMSYRNAILAGLALAGVVVAAILGRFGVGSAGLAIGGFVLAVLAQLRAVFTRDLVASTSTSDDVTKPTATEPKANLINNDTRKG